MYVGTVSNTAETTDGTCSFSGSCSYEVTIFLQESRVHQDVQEQERFLES
jgi:hypothetical protein